jgi:uncharacterized membrane protein
MKVAVLASEPGRQLERIWFVLLGAWGSGACFMRKERLSSVYEVLSIFVLSIVTVYVLGRVTKF